MHRKICLANGETNLYNLDRALLAQKAAETGFIRDNLEKVYRLTDVLIFLSEHPCGNQFGQY